MGTPTEAISDLPAEQLPGGEDSSSLPAASVQPSQATEETPGISVSEVISDNNPKKKEKKKKEPSPQKPNIFKRISASIREWRHLQRSIQNLSATIAKNQWEVEEGLNNYRLALSEVSFKAAKLDLDIWENHTQITARVPVIQRQTKKTPLFLLNNTRLRELNTSWEKLCAQQDYLLDTLNKAPKSVEFYNRIHHARIRKREQEVRESEIVERTAQAKESIERALSKLSLGEATFDGNPESGILRLEDAKNYWSSRMQEIANLETTTRMDPDEIISIYRNLETSLQEAPRMADQVKEVEVMFTRLMAMHEELNSFGKTIIPAEDLARFLITVQDEIPKLWATGAWDKLHRTLNDVKDFVKFYDLPVKSELSLAERRKPGLTRALLAGASTLPITQVTPMVRSLVSAIDARDKFMSGHSDAVARIAVQMARKMNWSGEDLELLEIASLLHDVGKIMIPENILTKLDPLTPEDWQTIRMHPYHGARIVKSIDALSKATPWVYHHQERWDGKGYPDGISDKNIPLAARIIAVGEAFTVMTTDQPKRKALSLGDAVEEIRKGAGTQFDPDVAGALVQAIESPEPRTGPINR